jgi:hypothetical protein
LVRNDFKALADDEKEDYNEQENLDHMHFLEKKEKFSIPLIY